VTGAERGEAETETGMRHRLTERQDRRSIFSDILVCVGLHAAHSLLTVAFCAIYRNILT